MLFENGLAHKGPLRNFRISSGSLVCHSQPVRFSTSLTNGARQEITAPERDQRQVRVLRPRDVGKLLDIGRHVMPGGDPRLSQLAGTRGLAMPAQVERVGDLRTKTGAWSTCDANVNESVPITR